MRCHGDKQNIPQQNEKSKQKHVNLQPCNNDEMHPKCSGIYRIRDNIAKLEIVVHLKPLNSLVNLPPPLAHTHRTSTTTTDDLPVQLRLKWQQKVFGPHEAALYKDEAHCVTDTHRQYHKWLHDREEANARGRNKPRHRRRPPKKTPPDGPDYSMGGDIFTYTNADEHQPPEEAPPPGGANTPYGDRQSMYVYAALSPDTLLVALHWYPEHRLLQIYPDFNDLDDDPYLIEIDTDYRHLYQYSVVNASAQRRHHDAAPHITDYLQLPEMTKPLAFDYEASHRRRKEFDMPPKRQTRVALQLELRTAGGFPLAASDTLHVRYHVQLPDGVRLEDGLLQASTHSASPSVRHGLVRLGYTWELALLCEEHFQPEQQVRLFFEVISADSWSRERLEGYAHYAMFLVQPHSERVRLDCLRPVEGFMDRLRRYFIGGRYQYDFRRLFVADGHVLCNWRHEWQSSGQLELLVHGVTQKNCELWGAAEGRTAPESCGMTLDDIMKAYNEARRRLEAVIF